LQQDADTITSIPIDQQKSFLWKSVTGCENLAAYYFVEQSMLDPRVLAVARTGTPMRHEDVTYLLRPPEYHAGCGKFGLRPVSSCNLAPMMRFSRV